MKAKLHLQLGFSLFIFFLEYRFRKEQQPDICRIRNEYVDLAHVVGDDFRLCMGHKSAGLFQGRSLLIYRLHRLDILPCMRHTLYSIQMDHYMDELLVKSLLL